MPWRSESALSLPILRWRISSPPGSRHQGAGRCSGRELSRPAGAYASDAGRLIGKVGIREVIGETLPPSRLHLPLPDPPEEGDRRQVGLGRVLVPGKFGAFAPEAWSLTRESSFHIEGTRRRQEAYGWRPHLRRLLTALSPKRRRIRGGISKARAASPRSAA